KRQPRRHRNTPLILHNTGSSPRHRPGARLAPAARWMTRPGSMPSRAPETGSRGPTPSFRLGESRFLVPIGDPPPSLPLQAAPHRWGVSPTTRSIFGEWAGLLPRRPAVDPSFAAAMKSRAWRPVRHRTLPATTLGLRRVAFPANVEGFSIRTRRSCARPVEPESLAGRRGPPGMSRECEPVDTPGPGLGWPDTALRRL